MLLLFLFLSIISKKLVRGNLLLDKCFGFYCGIRQAGKEKREKKKASSGKFPAIHLIGKCKIEDEIRKNLAINPRKTSLKNIIESFR